MEDKKAAKKLAAETKKRQMQKDFLSREQALDAETLKKLKEKWFEILLKSKLPEMKENLRSIMDYMEKLVEVEIFRKRLFEEERAQNEDQLDLQSKSHADAIDNLYDLYLQRIRDLHEVYAAQIEKKKEDAENEFEKIRDEKKKSEDNLKAIFYQMTQNQEKKEDARKCFMFLQLDDEKSKSSEKNENLRFRLERLMEKRWTQISNVLSEYNQNTKQRRDHYLELEKRDRHSSKVIRNQMKKTQKLYDQIQQMKNSLENPDPSDKKMVLISDYREERNKFYSSFMYLKYVLGEGMNLDDTQLRYLTEITKDVYEYLDRFTKKGGKVLTLFSLCLKLETEKEKVVPVGRNLYRTRIPKAIMDKLVFPPWYEFNSEVDKEVIKKAMLDEFRYFWQKFGKVRLSIVGLSKCISNMEAENATLKRILNSYFGQIKQKN